MNYPSKFIVLKDTPDHPAGAEICGSKSSPWYAEPSGQLLSIDYLFSKHDWFKPVYETQYWQPTEGNSGCSIETPPEEFVFNYPSRFSSQIGLQVPTIEDAKDLISRLETTIKAFHQERYSVKEAA